MINLHSSTRLIPRSTGDRLIVSFVFAVYANQNRVEEISNADIKPLPPIDNEKRLLVHHELKYSDVLLSYLFTIVPHSRELA